MRAVVLLVALAGCAYPEFAFTRDGDTDSAATDGSIDTRVALDTNSDTFVAMNDTTVEPVDTAAAPDTMMVDTTVVDTTVVDTAMPDTKPPPDTAAPPDTKADVAADVPVSTGCTGVTAIFCSDWDKATVPESEYTYFGLNTGGSIAIDVAAGRSSPNAFLATTTPNPMDPVVVANLTKTFTRPTIDTVMRLDGWIKLESATFPGSGTFLFKIQRGDAGGDGVTFSVNSGGYFVDTIGTPYEYHPIAKTPLVGVWSHIRMDVKLHTTAGSVTAWIDDMTTPVLTRTGLSTVKADVTSTILIVGLYSQGSTGTFKARYDDVTLNYK